MRMRAERDRYFTISVLDSIASNIFSYHLLLLSPLNLYTHLHGSDDDDEPVLHDMPPAVGRYE